MAAKTREDLLKQAKAEILQLDSPGLFKALQSPQPPLLLDVREQDEVDLGFISGAVHIPRGQLEMLVEGKLLDRDRPVAIYCAGGNRSALAGQTLKTMGYASVSSLAGGFSVWKRDGFPVTVERPLTPAQRKRYARHLTLPEVGEVGQKKMLNAKVIMVGAGGLGSPAAYYLAAAGVGTLGIVDDDVVDVTNLQRQILHREEDQGRLKAESAERALKALNPEVNVRKHIMRINSENALDIIKDYDVILDGTDNFPTRYLLNDAGVLLGKPVVHGSIFRFEGQVTTFAPHLRGPSYRCLYPEPPPPDMAPSCTEGGVLGVLPGVVGTLQAVEVLKLVCDIGQPLIGRLLQFDALAMRFRELKLRRSADWPEGAPHPTVKGLIDYEAFCTVRGG